MELLPVTVILSIIGRVNYVGQVEQSSNTDPSGISLLQLSSIKFLDSDVSSAIGTVQRVGAHRQLHRTPSKENQAISEVAHGKRRTEMLGPEILPLRIQCSRYVECLPLCHPKPNHLISQKMKELPNKAYRDGNDAVTDDCSSQTNSSLVVVIAQVLALTNAHSSADGASKPV